jgi:hypothetical protein
MTHVGRIALATAGCAVLAAVPVALGAGAADRAAATRAAAWLAGESPSSMPAGQQADVMVAMRITGTPARALAPRLRPLAQAAPGYADAAGATAKVVLGAVAGGGDPRRLGGTDYLAKLRSQSSGGRYGRTAFDQALSMIALRAATGRVPQEAVTTLLGAQANQGWNFELSPTGEADVDSTALSVVALRAAGQPCGSPAIRSARAWLATQRSGGGWTAYAGSPPSANSTALVARADIACGAPARGALDLLRSLQQRSGAIRFTRAQPESRLLATSESVAPLAGVSLARGLRPG